MGRAPVIVAGLAVSFAAGLLAARWVPDARAQSAPPALTPQIIHLATMADEEIGPIVPNTELRSRTLVNTEWGTVGVQVGNVFKHIHADANEVQFIIEGTGTAWLGGEQREIKPGDLVVIPKGTPHAGTKPTSGRFKAIAIKLPPQKPTDTIPVD